jgi:hypothetical protein
MKVALLVTEIEIRFILQAISLDLNDELTYSIVAGTMSATHSSIQHLVDRNPFFITNNELKLNFDVQENMEGMFTFHVQVINLGQFLHYWSLVGTSACKIQLLNSLMD